ncbi:MAG: FecR domain-containing protein [Tannerella sp.]|jgi:ferric-dicitrate binding protein FerR (iron transport regulator)|nr:FecR domain-containing protein [Tannerella sp.]
MDNNEIEYMDNNEIEDDYSGMPERIRFRSLPYNKKENYERLKERISGTCNIIMSDKNIRIWKYVAVAASFALLLVSLMHLVDLSPREELVWFETTAVPDAKTKIVLPDSSVVWMNANACLRYPRSFDDEQRKVSITGEAFFEVRKDEKPFIVQMEDVYIKVLGTSFNVITDDQPDKTVIALLEGKIALFRNDNKTDIPDKLLKPNQQAVCDASSQDIAVSTIRPENVTSWVTGVFRFEGNTLEEIVGELQRAFHVKIHVENEMMRRKTFYAVFDDKETLDEILSILQISARYSIEKRRGEVYIY